MSLQVLQVGSGLPRSSLGISALTGVSTSLGAEGRARKTLVTSGFRSSSSSTERTSLALPLPLVGEVKALPRLFPADFCADDTDLVIRFSNTGTLLGETPSMDEGGVAK